MEGIISVSGIPILPPRIDWLLFNLENAVSDLLKQSNQALRLLSLGSVLFEMMLQGAEFVEEQRHIDDCGWVQLE